MHLGRRLEAKEVALVICFTALYTVFSFVPAFPIVGLGGKAITLAAITAPIIGIILGSHLAMLSTFLGGQLHCFLLHLSPLQVWCPAVLQLFSLACYMLINEEFASSCISHCYSSLDSIPSSAQFGSTPLLCGFR